MEFDEHKDDVEEEEEEEMVTATAKTTSSSGGGGGEGDGSGGGSARIKSRNSSAAAAPVRYRECLKNHAVGIGGHAVDGCGEFMAAGEEGSLDALKCAACNCHRNFHRKETAEGAGEPMIPQQNPPPPPQFSPYNYRGAAPPPPHLHRTAPSPHRPLALPAAGGGGGYSREEEDVSNPSSSGGGGGANNNSSGKKRFRTKFTAEQKEMMRRFSERIGWRIQKQDEGAVERFCAETGVRRKVLKVWMHNNKHTLGKEPS
ncbi:unnamed protein product [Linum trigynum]|uniref:ZF-HD dimerization-type domain-containing protein n=1 Tax=Linum trigynum TaxID=586398 RepID=A0AAV2FBM6_9ROSI